MSTTCLFPRRTVLTMALGAGCFALRPSLSMAADLSPADFRDLIIAVGARHYPSLPIRPTLAQLEVLWGDHHLYLYNAYAAIRGFPAEHREDAILNFLSHFSPEADARAAAIMTKAEKWDTAQPLLRPKLLPAEMIARAPRIVHRPFFADVMIGYSVDLGDKDLYVDRRRVDQWGTSVEQVHAAALDNLEAMSTSFPPESLKAERVKPLLHVSTNDGYDAARIVLPGLRARLVATLGPVFAGIPGRDLLVVWPQDYGGRAAMEALIRDYAAQTSHRITTQIFAIDKDGIRPA